MQIENTYDWDYNARIISNIDNILSETKENISILDVGCWTWSLWRILRYLWYHNHTIDWIDYVDFALKESKNNWYNQLFNINLHSPDMSPIEWKKYDIIIFWDVLEHTLEPKLIFDSISDLLNDWWTILVSLPNIWFILYRLKLLFWDRTYNPLWVWWIMDVTHYKFFTLSSMMKLLSKDWFKITLVSWYNSVSNKYFYLRFLWNLFPSLFALQICFLVKRIKNI